MDEKLKQKLPIGIVDKQIRERERFEEIHSGLISYISQGLLVDIDWVKEYNELLEKFASYRAAR